jgi:RNA polymerase sigma-70 factor (ECF subfamily)
MTGETFEALLAPNLRFVRQLVQTRLGAFGDADDATQEILLLAFTHRDQLRDQAKFKTWLWSIALNVIRMRFRRNRGVISLDELPGLEIADAAISPVARLERIENREFLSACMAELPERDQAAIRLRDIEGRSLRETAAALHRSLSATKSAHFRARRRLAHLIRTGDRRAVRPARAAA